MEILLNTTKKSQMVFRNISLFLLLQAAIFAFSQTNNPYPDIIPSSPTVASIEKFGDYPIGYNTGTVGISTDLYSFSLGKGLNLDIRLDYHSSGIKVENVSDRVGTGWTLLAGGCISRQVRGKKDEATGSGFYNFIKTHKGYKFPEDMLNPTTGANTADSIARDIKDPSPDIFSLNLLGRSYKFFLGNDGELHTIPYSNLKFSKHPLISEAGGPWEITDESGIRYTFGLIEETLPPGGGRKEYASAWWLTSIVSAEGNTLVSFEYNGAEPVYANIPKRTAAFVITEGPPSYPEEIKNIYVGDKTHSDNNRYSSWDLSRINIPGKGYIVFESGTSWPEQVWKLVSEIKYYDNNNILANKYSLSYTQQGRPFLSQILKTGSDGVTVKYRTFTYYPGLPNPYSKAQDVWGYYNGATSNSGLYPYEGAMIGYAYTSADRYPSDKTVAGTIKEITYPTGGKTLFEFENNKVYGTDNIYSIRKENFSHTQTDFGEVTSGSFSTVSEKLNMKIEMSIHPAGLYSVDISLIKTNNNSTILHYTNTSVPGNGFVNMGTNPDGTQRFVCNLTQYPLQTGTYKWVTKIINNDDRPNRPKPSPVIISNEYYRVTTSTETREKLVGGLRIARITNYGSDGNVTGKIRYTYLDKNGICSGVAAPSPVFLRQYVVTENVCPQKVVPCYSDMKLIEIGEADLNQYSGSAVQYTYVTEERTGEGSVSLKTDYEYRKREFIRNNLPHPEGLINYTPYSPNEYEEGLLISKTDYEFQNNAYTPVRKEANTYIIKDQGSDIPSFTAVSLNKYYTGPEIPPYVTNMSHYIKYQLGTYSFKSAKVYLSSKKIEEIAPGGTISNIYDYFYENTTYQQLTRSRQTGSNGLVSEVAYKYCYDENTAVTNEMKSKNILTPPLHTTNKVDNKQTKLADVIYEVFPGNILEPKTIREQTAVSTPYSETTYHNYDKYGNPLYISRNGSDQVVYLWSYSGQYPIAEIKNATLTEVTTVLNSMFGVNTADALSALTTPNETKLKDGSLQRALPNALVTTYTYKPLGGILTATDPSGITTYYDYDSFGRLKRTYIKENTTEKTIQTYDYHYQN